MTDQVQCDFAFWQRRRVFCFVLPCSGSLLFSSKVKCQFLRPTLHRLRPSSCWSLVSAGLASKDLSPLVSAATWIQLPGAFRLWPSRVEVQLALISEATHLSQEGHAVCQIWLTNDDSVLPADHQVAPLTSYESNRSHLSSRRVISLAAKRKPPPDTRMPNLAGPHGPNNGKLAWSYESF